MKTETTSQPQWFTPGEVNNNLHDGNVFDDGGMVLANCYSSLRSPQTIKSNAARVVECWNGYPTLLKENNQLKEENKLLKRYADYCEETVGRDQFPVSFKVWDRVRINDENAEY